MHKLITAVILSLLCGGFYPACNAADFSAAQLSDSADVEAVYQLCRNYKSWQEQADESARQISELKEILKSTDDDSEKAELLEALENENRQMSGLKKNIREGLKAAYGETRNLFPQFKTDIACPSLYDPAGYDPDSARMLAEARRLIAEIRSVNSSVYHADGSNAANPIEKRVWQDTASAIENTGKTLTLGLTNFFIRQEGKGRQKPDYLKNAEPVLTIGPFLKRGKGGDVPEGDQTYIDFYSLKKPQDNQYASVSYE
jgi:hypothetical protein